MNWEGGERERERDNMFCIPLKPPAQSMHWQQWNCNCLPHKKNVLVRLKNNIPPNLTRPPMPCYLRAAVAAVVFVYVSIAVGGSHGGNGREKAKYEVCMALSTYYLRQAHC